MLSRVYFIHKPTLNPMSIVYEQGRDISSARDRHSVLVKGSFLVPQVGRLPINMFRKLSLVLDAQAFLVS